MPKAVSPQRNFAQIAPSPTPTIPPVGSSSSPIQSLNPYAAVEFTTNALSGIEMGRLGKNKPMNKTRPMGEREVEFSEAIEPRISVEERATRARAGPVAPPPQTGRADLIRCAHPSGCPRQSICASLRFPHPAFPQGFRHRRRRPRFYSAFNTSARITRS
jgi:hypothetical protein